MTAAHHETVQRTGGIALRSLPHHISRGLWINVYLIKRSSVAARTGFAGKSHSRSAQVPSCPQMNPNVPCFRPSPVSTPTVAGRGNMKLSDTHLLAVIVSNTALASRSSISSTSLVSRCLNAPTRIRTTNSVWSPCHLPSCLYHKVPCRSLLISNAPSCRDVHFIYIYLLTASFPPASSFISNICRAASRETQTPATRSVLRLKKKLGDSFIVYHFTSLFCCSCR